MTVPWTRQRNEEGELEPMLWFRRFSDYRLMGPDRTMVGLCNTWRAGKGQKGTDFVPGAWWRIAEKWQWDARCESWDAAELDRIQSEYRADCDAWRERRFAFAKTVAQKAEMYLRFPVARTVMENEGKTVITEPLSAKQLRDAVTAFKEADALARTTTRETLPKVETDLTTAGEPVTFRVVYENGPENNA